MYMALWYGMKNAKTFGNLHSLNFNCENPGSMLNREIYMVRRIQGIQYIIYDKLLNGKTSSLRLENDYFLKTFAIACLKTCTADGQSHNLQGKLVVE